MKTMTSVRRGLRNFKKGDEGVTAKEYLEKIKKTSRNISGLNDELKEIRSRKDGLKSIDVSERVKTSAIFNNSLDELIDQEEEIIRERRAIHNDWWSCRQTIRKIENSDYRNVLRYYYLLNKKWDEVAMKIHVSERKVYQLHGHALEEFRKITKLP